MAIGPETALSKSWGIETIGDTCTWEGRPREIKEIAKIQVSGSTQDF